MLHAAGDTANNFQTPLNLRLAFRRLTFSCRAIFISAGTYNQVFRLSLTQTRVITFLAKLFKTVRFAGKHKGSNFVPWESSLNVLRGSTLSRKEEKRPPQQEGSWCDVSVLLNFHVLHVFYHLDFQGARSTQWKVSRGRRQHSGVLP